MTTEPSGYKEAFLRETRECLDEMNASLLAAEAAPERLDLIGEIFRATHTIKGMASMMRYERMIALCHVLESVLDRLRQGRLELKPCVDALFHSFDLLSESLGAIAQDKPLPDSAAAEDDLRAFLAASQSPARPQPPAALGPPAGASAPSALPVRVDRLDRLMNLAEEMIVAKSRFDQIRVALPDPELSAAVDALDRLASELQYQVTQARMTPVGLIFGRFTRLVRDLARRQGKDVLFVQEGGDIEVDRFISDDLSESLLHLLRNAVDHGIELPAERARLSKPARGTIRAAASRTKGSAVIEVEDDGAGLDLEAIRRAAGSRGLLAPDAGPQDVLKALFRGVSTVAEPTETSGRGAGLDVVARKMSSLGGSVTVDSSPGKGTRFRLEAPLTLAIVKTLLVDVGGRTYAIPMSAIERVLSVDARRIKPALGRETIVVDAAEVPLLRLRELFRMKPSTTEKTVVVVIGVDGAKLGLAVDALLTTQEIVLKPVNRALTEMGHFGGSAITGSGEPVLVLDAAGLLRRQAGAAT